MSGFLFSLKGALKMNTKWYFVWILVIVFSANLPLLGCAPTLAKYKLDKGLEPNACLEEGMTESAKNVRVGITKFCFFLMGMLPGQGILFCAHIFRCVATQRAKADIEGTILVMATLYGAEKGVNSLIPQGGQGVLQTLFSGFVSLGASFLGDRGYYFVPETNRPHLLARVNWDLKGYWQHIQFLSIIYGAASVGLASMALNAEIASHHVVAHYGIRGLVMANAEATRVLNTFTVLAPTVPIVAYGATNLANAVSQGSSYFDFETGYDRVWKAYGKKYGL